VKWKGTSPLSLILIPKGYALFIGLTYIIYAVWCYYSRIFYTFLCDTWLCDHDHDMWQSVTVTCDVMLTPYPKSK